MAKKKSGSKKYDKERAAARNRAHVKEKWQFLELLDQLCRSLKQPLPTDKKDRLPLLEMLFCLVFKGYSQISDRNLSSFLVEMRTLNYITIDPHFNSFGNYMNLPAVTLLLDTMLEKIVLASAEEGVHAAIDSSRLLTPGYHKEKVKKGRYKRERNNVRLHTIINIKTHLIVAAVVSKHYQDEKQFFEPLLRRALQRGNIISIAGDKNYLSKANVKIASELGCTPYLTPKKNNRSEPEQKGSLWNENIDRYREGSEEDAERFGQRKQIETTFSMIKLRFGKELGSKTFQAQINEALCLAICHNLRVLIFNRELHGTDLTFPPEDKRD